MGEKRAHPRRRVLKRGQIVFNGGRSIIDCTLRNLSETGALLKVENSLGIPTDFTLRYDSSWVWCTTVRRTLREIAVAFQIPPRTV
jgi:hypothetical protein